MYRQHKKYDMKQIFGQFDADGDGKLDIYEIARAFRAMGLPKRDGSKMEMDHGKRVLHVAASSSVALLIPSFYLCLTPSPCRNVMCVRVCYSHVQVF